MNKMNWYIKETDSTLKELGSSESGLTAGEASARLDKYGPNELVETEKRSLFMMFIDQFKDFMIMILIAAAIVSGVIGELVDTLAIIVIIILNAIIGFVQEYRAEQAMKALKQMAALTADVVRDGSPANISASEIVPGDIILLEAGRIVPADVRLLEAAHLKIEEAALTGESVPVEKVTKALAGESIPLGDRLNMAYKGTIVSYGRGIGVAVGTGMDTELGKIAALLQNEEDVKTPLQKRLAKFGQRLGIAVLAICAIVFTAGIFRGEEPLLMFLTAISLAVAAIPEALPAVVTISLALGARKMVKQNSLIRKLPAVETLGSVTYICSDKTGTLTLNKMTVEEIYTGEEVVKSEELGVKSEGDDQPSTLNFRLSIFLTAMALSNDAAAAAEDGVMGDPTEVALFNAAFNAGFIKKELESELPRVAELPFDSDRKMMTTFHKFESEGMKRSLALGPQASDPDFISFTKGSMEAVLERSTRVIIGGELLEMDDGIRERITKANQQMANDGLRAIAFAARHWDALPDEGNYGDAETGMTFLGIAGLLDPPREEAREAVKMCRRAGIHPVMITGDHPLTAKTIAVRLGIIDDGDGVMTGTELDKLSVDEFKDRVEDIRVYARVAPEQKLKIVKALQKKGEFVAMTGDGVNDAPALKRADIGVAMGITGTDVSKEASHMILLDDNFSTIVKAVREGRRIFDNIRKFIKYTMTSNSGEIWTIFLAPFLGLPIPLLPIHILWINLVTDGLPGLALAVEPEERGVMQRKPRHPQESIFAHGMAAHMIWVGLLMGGVSIFSQFWAISNGYDQARWQTMVFTVLCLSQMGHVLAIRSERESLFSIGLFTNKPLLGAVALTFIMQMATIYIPFLNPVFKTSPLPFTDLMFAILLSTVVFMAVEVEKFWFRRKVY